MEFKKLTEDVRVPVLGLGTSQMGGKTKMGTTHDAECINAIKKAVEMGYTHIDTAEVYANGHTEELVSEAIKGIDRKKLFITTKVWKENLKYDDVIKAAKNSLKRLQMDYVDLYLVHAPNESIPIQETMKAMDYLVEQGITKFIGVSNFSVEQLKEAQKHTKNKIVANQIEYNLMTRENGQWTDKMESEIIPYCNENGILVIAWRPVLLGNVPTDKDLLNELAKKYNKTIYQIAINWIISKNNIVTIVKSTNVDHLKEDIEAVNWKIDKEDIERLDKL